MSTMKQEQQREKLGSRLGFILLAAGSSIGLGNVWRFPYIVGEYGGAAFILVFVFFLLFLGLPIMVMEYAVGRAAQRNIGLAFKVLQPKGTRWDIWGHVVIFTNYVIVIFYTTVSGWMLAYCYYTAKGDLTNLTNTELNLFFSNFLANPWLQVFWMGIVVFVGVMVCSAGLQKGVEKITKGMMVVLLLSMVILAMRSLTLEGGEKGLTFFLVPDFDALMEKGFWDVTQAAMGQAFFTLSLGMGFLTIFGSYTSKERSLTGGSLTILGLDTFVGFMAALIIFPAAFAYGINVDSGPSLVLVTLPNIFNSMPLGQVWGTLFFVFLSFAALTTIIAFFENLASYGMDVFKLSRKKSTWIQGGLVFLLSIPCALGFNVFADFQPLGAGTNILDLEDFIGTSNFLPINSLVFVFFCCYSAGWGWKNFIAEANTGKGIKFPVILYYYIKYILPLIIIFVFVQGYITRFY